MRYSANTENISPGTHHNVPISTQVAVFPQAQTNNDPDIDFSYLTNVFFDGIIRNSSNHVETKKATSSESETIKQLEDQLFHLRQRQQKTPPAYDPTTTSCQLVPVPTYIPLEPSMNTPGSNVQVPMEAFPTYYPTSINDNTYTPELLQVLDETSPNMADIVTSAYACEQLDLQSRDMLENAMQQSHIGHEDLSFSLSQTIDQDMASTSYTKHQNEKKKPKRRRKTPSGENEETYSFVTDFGRGVTAEARRQDLCDWMTNCRSPPARDKVTKHMSERANYINSSDQSFVKNLCQVCLCPFNQNDPHIAPPCCNRRICRDCIKYSVDQIPTKTGVARHSYVSTRCYACSFNFDTKRPFAIGSIGQHLLKKKRSTTPSHN